MTKKFFKKNEDFLHKIIVYHQEIPIKKNLNTV